MTWTTSTSDPLPRSSVLPLSDALIVHTKNEDQTCRLTFTFQCYGLARSSLLLGLLPSPSLLMRCTRSGGGCGRAGPRWSRTSFPGSGPRWRLEGVQMLFSTVHSRLSNARCVLTCSQEGIRRRVRGENIWEGRHICRISVCM